MFIHSFCGVIGPVHPPSRDMNSVPMFGEVKRLTANDSRFNNVVGTQYNVGYRSRKCYATSLYVSITILGYDS